MTSSLGLTYSKLNKRQLNNVPVNKTPVIYCIYPCTLISTLYIYNQGNHPCIAASVWIIYTFAYFPQSVPHVVIDRLVLCGHLDAVSQEAEDSSDPEQDGEAAEQLTAELHPLGGGGRGGQGVGTVPGQDLHRPGVGQALGGGRMERECFSLQHNRPIFTAA